LNKRFGLGKGLGALIPEEDTEVKSELKSNLIQINLIKANCDQPRKYFDKEKIEQLAESIKEHGIIQPLVLNKDGDTYIIIAGERRWRAAKLAGLKEVPAVLMDISNEEVLQVSLIENIQRQDLNPIEEALAYRKLIDEFKLTQEALSNKIGKSRAAIANSMRLLSLDKRVQEYLIEGIISEGHGRALLSLPTGELQYKLAQAIIDNSLSVREVEKLIKNYNKNTNSKTTKLKKENPFFLDIKDKLEGLFGTKVQLSNNKSKGKIEIEYYSEDDLQRILDILKL
jgi:ParB family transcriptional regulator, chromosome partitioning protein